ncbi:MAG TPA: GNAT family N-acetyltransferase [Rhizomicrobium sp.]|jgi:predicted N-acetyltransferase YhbS|nr:GNAT family N-acetyltransferase [Rhizomicrobium sp.]
MSISIREVRAEDAPECGRICYEAFAAIARAHNFQPDFPNAELVIGLFGVLIDQAGIYGVVAEEEGGRIAGSNFLHERDAIAGLGPITIDPALQNRGIGDRLMRVVLDRAAARNFAGVRLVQAGYHCRSLSLYLKLGFDVREHLACLQGPPIRKVTEGFVVRAATDADLEACNALCVRVHGAHRGGELRQAVAHGAARLVERAGRISGYATQIAFFGHAVAETNDGLKALIAGADAFPGPGFIVPSRNGELMRWCLEKGLRVTQPLTLMTMGLYNEPAGAWLPSILY